MIRVIEPGFLTTVQDLGRYGYAHLGVSASGAADALSLRAGNLLVGNHENAAALEMTLAGGTFEFDPPAVIALTGAEFEAGVPAWQAVEASSLRCGPARNGARCYLCVRGGIASAPVLGSRSTHLLTGLGGRKLRAGDLLATGGGEVRRPSARVLAPPRRDGVLRATPGPQSDWFSGGFYGWEYVVLEASNRMGLRLAGPALERRPGNMVTEGVPLGAVQVPPEGQPIILFVEHQTTGGYPKIANVISADMHAAGQLRPRDTLTFAPVNFERALALLREQEQWLRSI
ncbi:MAG: biotin-dependent carboxyltransferase family protein [Bryobacteraceae bacterium]